MLRGWPTAKGYDFQVNIDHEAMHAASRFSQLARETLSTHFVGIYLHGSLTLNAFRAGVSDLDLICVVSAPVPDPKIADLAHAMRNEPLSDFTSGTDLTLVSAADAASPTRNSRWIAYLRQSPSDSESVVIQRDSDIGFFTDLELTRQHGVCLLGPAVADVFGPVPRDLVIHSCLQNCRVWANRNAFNDPVSAILTACRAWRFLETGRMGSKREAGLWALDQHTSTSLISAALIIDPRSARSVFRDHEVKAFCSMVVEKLAGADCSVNITAFFDQ